MNLYTQYSLRSNSNYIRFLRENSYWYRYLNRNINNFSLFQKEMKQKYKLTSSDKSDRFTKNIDRMSQIIDIFS